MLYELFFNYAYSAEESKSIVAYIIRQVGIEGLLSVLNQLRQCEGLDNALMGELSLYQ